jgi:hypothetical protein
MTAWLGMIPNRLPLHSARYPHHAYRAHHRYARHARHADRAYADAYYARFDHGHQLHDSRMPSRSILAKSIEACGPGQFSPKSIEACGPDQVSQSRLIAEQSTCERRQRADC